MFGSRTSRIRRARLVPLALTTAALSSAVIGASVTGTLSAFNATITNSNNTATAGSLVMQEFAQDGSTSCLSSTGTDNTNASCSTINKYTSAGQPDFVPGTNHINTVRFANLGTSDVTTFTLKPGACTQHKASETGGMDVDNICDSLHLTLTCAPVTGGTAGTGGTVGTEVPVYTNASLTSINTGTPLDLGAISSTCIPVKGSGNTVQFKFTLSMPTGQTNKVQGQDLSQPLTWTFTGATGV